MKPIAKHPQHQDKLNRWLADEYPKGVPTNIQVRTDDGGTIWVADAYGAWPVVDGRIYYGMLVYRSDGTCSLLRDC